jgi:lipoate-protein ligase A
MVNVNMEALSQTLGEPAPQKHLANLHDVFSREVTVNKIKKAIIKGFEKRFNVKLEEGKLTSKERQVARKLYEDKYSNTNWNSANDANRLIPEQASHTFG